VPAMKVDPTVNQFYVDRHQERQAQNESQDVDEDGRNGSELRGESSGS
jgi:hypothetical protein